MITVLANDTPGTNPIDPSTVTIASLPTSGIALVTVNPATGEITYNPNGFAGPSDSFTYTVNDTTGLTSNVATVTITFNAAPIAVDDEVNDPTRVPIVINVLANDIDTTGTIDPTTVTIVSPPASGVALASVNPTTGEISYDPNGFGGGSDTLTYNVRDSLGLLSNTATVTVYFCVPPAPVDGTLPDGFVQSVTPPNGATNVPLTTTFITIVYTQAMGGNVTAPGQYDVYQQANIANKILIIPPVVYNPGTMTATLTLNTADPDWIANTVYQIEIKGSVQSSCGQNQTGGGSTSIFTTFQTAP